MTSILLFFSAYPTFGHASSRLTRVFQTFQFLLGDPEVFPGFSTMFWVYPRVCSLLGVHRKSLGGLQTRCPNHFIWFLLTCRSSSSTPRSLQISELLLSNIIIKSKLFLSQIVLPFRVKQMMKHDLLRIMATFLIDNLLCYHFWGGINQFKKYIRVVFQVYNQFKTSWDHEVKSQESLLESVPERIERLLKDFPGCAICQ